MKTFTIEISEEQLRLIQAALNHLRPIDLMDAGMNDEQMDELDLIVGMIEDVIEGEEEEGTVHGFCY